MRTRYIIDGEPGQRWTNTIGPDLLSVLLLTLEHMRCLPPVPSQDRPVLANSDS